jgi:uncharacterized iron-regulated membrane protein
MVGRVHLILGLPLAVYAIVMGGTGAALVFRDAIHAGQHPHLYSGPAPVYTATPDQALTAVRARYPGWNPLSVTWPHERTPYWMIYLLRGPAAREVYVSTATGEIVGDRDPRAGWLGVAERIHNNWYWGRNGRLLNGYGAIGLTLLSLSGLWLVWPRLRHLRLDATFFRNRDLHYWLGTISCVFVLVVSFTGAYYTWGASYRELAYRWLGHRAEIRLPERTASATRSVAELVERAQREFPGKPVQRAPIPDPKFPYRVSFREGAMSEIHKVSSVTLDPRTGEVLAKEALAQRPAGDTFVGMLSAVHFGVFGGAPVEWLWALLSLAMATLGPTGVLIWWRKRRS